MVSVSIVIPTYNRLARLKRVLKGLEQQSYPLDNTEVLVVSDGSSDGTDEYLNTIQTPLQLIPLFQSNCGVAAARNHGVAEARGEILLFIDDDIIPAQQLVSEHVHTHATQGHNLVVLGPMLTPTDFVMAPWVRWEQAMLVKQYTAMTSGCWHPTARQFYTGNASLRRHHLVDVGGFDKQFRRAEDVELAYRLATHGLRFTFNPEAVGYHYADRSFRSWLEIPYAYGRNDVIFTRDKQQGWLLPQVFREFKQRNSLIRSLTYVCVGRSFLQYLAVAALATSARLANRVGAERFGQMAYSAIFNLRYYEGITDELGGRHAFLARTH